MSSTSVAITTPDGTAPARVFRPDGAGPWPGILVFIDAIGVRPAMWEIGERLASHGYVVLVPDLFYRTGPAVPPSMAAFFGDAAVRQAWMTDHVSKARTIPDVPAYLDFLAAQPDIVPEQFGTTGYCMGGRLSIVAAGTYPERIAAAAAYHPGNLVSDKPDSAHLLAPNITARIYVAGAIEDPSFTDAMRQQFVDALVAAKHQALGRGQVIGEHVVETYPARHGFVPTDSPAHDAAAAARHWETLLALFATTFKRPG